MRRAIEEHLLSSPNLALTSNFEVTSLDNQLETCRVAALIYVIHALRPELDAKYPSVALKPLITLGRWTKLELDSPIHPQLPATSVADSGVILSINLR